MPGTFCLKSCPNRWIDVTRYCLLAALLWSFSSLINAAELAIIIDDVGYNATAGQQLVELNHAVTLAVLPFTPHGKKLANSGARYGKEIMLHAPMSATRPDYADKHMLTGSMSNSQLQALLKRMLAEVPHARGINNHMGSQLTRETGAMHALMHVLADRQLYFIDSRTTDKTVALDTARENGLPAMKRDVFLDNRREKTAITRQVQQAIQLAQRQGYAVAIGHPYPETIAVLKQLDALLADTGVTVVPASQLIAQHAPAATYLPKPLPLALCAAPPLLLWRTDAELNRLWQDQQHRSRLKKLFYPDIVTQFER
ncbi:divergent polysaccharide deacetylase family protein [Cellvibrio sp. KB43]|uniref:Divergent polysaccharide deacetylase family protein n=1 Tax=Cellvibrio polysaccharolyticus TaxID=2082724 RepID=A0A928VAM3_9GAMM|nr:divergent polysaccharide deacetylase family protein [Cellvibrio polysaccharolyticus]